MKVPPEIASKYSISDLDTAVVLANFDEREGSTVLEVGAHDEPMANLLVESGFRVTGVDLREYNPCQDQGKKYDGSIPCNYDYYRADFCDLRPITASAWLENFDSVISISAIEHFGYGTYGEGPPHLFYDVIAMRQVWQFLKVGGTAYITVPYGGKFVEAYPHWRIYDRNAISSRVVQDFRVEQSCCFVADEIDLNGRRPAKGEVVSWQEADRYQGSVPHLTVFLKLRKVKVNRLAPDGR